MKDIITDLILAFMSTLSLSSFAVMAVRFLSVQAGIRHPIERLYSDPKLKPTYVRVTVLTMCLLCGIGAPYRHDRRGDTYVKILLHHLVFTVIVGIPTVYLLYNFIGFYLEKSYIPDVLFVMGVLSIELVFMSRVVVSYWEAFLPK
jgi:hypothetical protein